MDMSERIKARRLETGYTQEELAEKLGLQKSAIAKYENGRVENIKRTTISNMAKILDCSPAYLMGWEDNLTPQTASLQVKLLSDEQLLKYVNKLLTMSNEKKERIYGYMDSIDEQ